MIDKLKVVLCWHMHQPVYQDLLTGEYRLPWTYLHAIKDYVDMVAHLEAVPDMHVVVNFAPILLEQIDDYAKQVSNYLRKEQPITDPLLQALVSETLPQDAEERFILIDQCLRANQERIIDRFPAYKKLAELSDWLREKHEVINYLDQQYLVDILMWYHLAWLGEFVRREDARVEALMQKERGYDQADRRQLLEIIGEILTSLIPRYKALSDRQQIELSFTPYAHPIMPLLYNLRAAQQAAPNVTLPEREHYPDGEKRIHWHIREGMKVFKKYFGIQSQGCWPSEGGVSEATLKILSDAGIRWVATGENVLRHSLMKSQQSGHCHHPFQLKKLPIRCFFRDDGLSDAVGFTYANWHGDDAVANFVHHLENIAHTAPHTGANVVSVILDGENAWEFYYENGYYFLSGLYQKLANHPTLEVTTFSQCLDTPAKELSTLVAGSWVYGSFSTWIGDKDKNRGWDMLFDAKEAYDKNIKNLKGKQRTLAEKQLAICEGSDWCWWFGAMNPSNSVASFDSLYRLHLSNLYRILGETPPDYLLQAFTFGSQQPVAAGGTMRLANQSSQEQNT
jgi:alpha-amylase/alpha-mannosidase (GH57 family)